MLLAVLAVVFASCSDSESANRTGDAGGSTVQVDSEQEDRRQPEPDSDTAGKVPGDQVPADQVPGDQAVEDGTAASPGPDQAEGAGTAAEQVLPPARSPGKPDPPAPVALPVTYTATEDQAIADEDAERAQAEADQAAEAQAAADQAAADEDAERAQAEADQAEAESAAADS